MKKVLIISTSPIQNDGLSKLIFEIVTHKTDNYTFEIAAPENVDYIKSIESNIKGYILPKKKNVFKYMSSIADIVKNNNYDIVYIHGNSAMMFPETFATKTSCSSRILTHCHSDSSNYIVGHYLIKPLFNLFVDTKIGVSESASNWAYMGKNINTIPNGIDVDRYVFDKNNRDKIRKQLNIKDNELLIGNVGRFSKQKNQMFLLDVFNEYASTNNNSKLLLIGDGELKQDIINKINKLNLDKKVIILDSVTDIEKYYSAMDVMVLPSIFEGFGLVALEAQANGLPTVVSDVFPKEVFCTDLIDKMPLESNYKEWVLKMDNCYNSSQRGQDTRKQLESNGLTTDAMISKIYELL